MHRLTDVEIAHALTALPDWEAEAGGLAIERHFVFADFAEAFAFMTRVALAAERLDHHPDWSNAWNRVAIRLSTHAAGGLTSADFALARAIDAAAGGRTAPAA